MLLQILKCKLQDVIITKADTEYEGSITLDPLLMEAAELHPYERVEVNGVNSDSRIVTYVIPGEKGSGCVELNGGAANFFEVGQHIHVNCFAFIDEDLISFRTRELPHNPIIAKTDKNNKVISYEGHSRKF